MKLIKKMVALLVLTIVAFVANAYVAAYVACLFFPPVLPRPYVEMATCALAGGLGAAALVAYPLVRIYAHRASMAALVVAAPIVYLRANEALYYAGKDQTRILVMAWLELLLFPTVILLGVWLASRHLAHKPGR